MLIGPGFFSDEAVRTALLIGGGAATVSAVVGVFTIMRGQAFASEALADVSSAGGSAAFLIGASPLFGFLCMAAGAAGAIAMLGESRVRERDIATGIVLGGGLGFAALFLYFDINFRNTSGATISVLFGSMFSIPPAIVPAAFTVAALCLAACALLYRPLLLATLDPVLAQVRGVNVRRLELAHLLILAMAVALSGMTIGAVLSTALLIGPAATGLRLARRPSSAIILAVTIGLVATWGGILLAYNSFYWNIGHGWPLSFFVVAIIFATYFVSLIVRCDGFRLEV